MTDPAPQVFVTAVNSDSDGNRTFVLPFNNVIGADG
jgi:hypothetical protein